MTPNQNKKPTNNLEKEKLLVPLLLFALITSAITGITTHLSPSNLSWEQWGYLSHTLSGIILSFATILYSFQHFRRTTGVRRPLALISGLITIVILYSLILSGTYITTFGVIESLRWIFDWHIFLAYTSLLLIVLHLLIHRYTRNRHIKHKNFEWFISIKQQHVKNALIKTVLVLLIVSVICTVFEFMPANYKDTPVITPYDLSRYGNHPFRPSQTETTLENHFVDEKQISGSSQCGACHQQIFKEWQASMHSQAASDKAYVSNVSLLADNQGIAATRYCEGCHAPIALLTGQLTPGGKHGGVDGSLANKEGISCISCHGIERAVHLKGVASYEFKPATNYLFASSDNKIAKKIHNFLIQIHPQEHRKTMSRPILKKPEMCATCHVQFMDKEMNNWGWIKMQDEYTAWLNSHYSGQNEQTFRKQEPLRCQSCHFALTSGDDPSADDDGRIASHRSLGANTAIPYLNGDMQQFLLTKKFLQANKLSLTIEKPWRKDATRSSLYIDEKIRAKSETPFYLYLGEQSTIKLTVTNLQVGHDFPGGTTDINQAWIYFKIADAENRLIYESGNLNETHDVDPQAHFYRSIPTNRQGQHVWRHDLFKKTGESYRNTIPAGDSDIVEYTFDVPYWAKGPLTVTALLRYRKFNQRYARWALKDENIELPITNMARDALSIPLLIKPEIKQ